LIGKTGVHAIRALTQLTGLPEGQSLGAARIAERIDAPPNYLAKLLRILAREGLVESLKGPGGGFRLARDPRKIRLLDVVEPIEGVTRWNRCILRQRECSDEEPCAIHDRWKPLRDGYLALLAETTIADLEPEPEA
jgi:Rrf2 family iron-sulfur cluster assembly transcriptional regulator